MKSLIIHIGYHKTGSSSIQDSLYSDHVKGEYQYISFGRANSSLIIGQAFDEKYKDRPLVKSKSVSPFAVSKIKNDALNKITQTLDKTTCDTGIISAEDINKLNPKDLKLFHIFLNKYADYIQIAGYIREPRSFVESAFQQILKQRYFDIKTKSVTAPGRKSIEKYDNEFGRDNVNIWPFDKKSLYMGDVVADFYNRIGLRSSSKKIERSNEGLSVEAVKLLYIYRIQNRLYRIGDDEIIKKLSELKGDKLTFSESLLLKIANIEHNSSEWISNRINYKFDEMDFETKPGNITCIEDMTTIASETLEWLSENAKINIYSKADVLEISRAVSALK